MGCRNDSCLSHMNIQRIRQCMIRGSLKASDQKEKERYKKQKERKLY